MSFLDLDRFRTTKAHKSWWQKRQQDWKFELSGWSHPHRQIIVEMLKEVPWLSLIEVGVGSGANLKRILQYFHDRQLGGADVNENAIEFCKKAFKGGHFFVDSGDRILLSDKSTDVLLSDMTYIYVGPRDIKRYLKEVIRITRSYIIICEFHSTKWWERLWWKIIDGKNIYNWKKLLSKMDFYDIIEYKLTKEDWPESPAHQKYCSVFMAKVPKK
jgi:ubiquinone/menaquinone biosynthesis C-methylase UbiE